MRILTSSSPAADIAALAGGKGGNLYRLGRHGVATPRWAVLGADVFRHVRRCRGLDRRIAEILAGLDRESTSGCARELERLILDAEPDDTVERLVARAYRHAGGGLVAVRSSGAEEDARQHSFAGQFATFLNVSGTSAVLDAVRRCWASAYAERALSYRIGHGLSPEGAEVAVVVQRMVEPDASGVLFTANPSSGRRDELVISAVYGLGEGLVSGAVDADTIILDRADGTPKNVVVGTKTERYDRDGPAGSAIHPVPPEQQDAPVLTDAQIDRLRALGERVERIFGSPQDVEWAIAGADLWALQSRPITTIPATATGALRVWDNSNIIESYGGLTAPLTFSFASHVYHRVYTEFCRALWVPYRQREEMDDWLRNMLGYFHGRVYYNLLNWYRLVDMVPLAPMNRRVLEISIGVQPLPTEISEPVNPYQYSSRARERIRRIIVGTRFVGYFLSIQWVVRRFLRHFYRTFEKFDRIDYESLSGEQVYESFLALEKDLILNWGPMVVLEAVIGWAFGLLLAATGRWLPAAPGWFAWAVASPAGEVESVEPARRLRALAERVRADPRLLRIVTTAPPEQARDRLIADGHQEFVDELAEYVRQFGYRSLNELKLEEPDLFQDPSALFRMLRAAVDTPAETRSDAPAGEIARLIAGLNPVRRASYGMLRRKARKAFTARERVRFCRTRAFGLTRRMMRAIGADLARAGTLADPADVFFLRLEELRAVVEGRFPPAELRSTIESRQHQAAQDARLTPPARFITHGPAYQVTLDWTAESTEEPADGTVELRGVPSGPGVAEGEARVVEAPQDIAGGVLVAYRTDPGWVGVLPSASALIIERGSPLTHVAIVARELGIPTVVQIKDVTRRIRTGMRVRVDGTAGTVRIVG